MHTLALSLGLLGSLAWLALVTYDWCRLRLGRDALVLDELLGGRVSGSWSALTVLVAVGVIGVVVSVLAT